MTAPPPRFRTTSTVPLHPPGPAVIATAPRFAMTDRTRKPRTFTHAHRQRLDRAIAHYLDECYAQRSAARVSEFAAFLQRNPEYLTRTTVAIVGIPLRAYLRRKQLQEAERLITTTPLSLREVALHAGFGGTSTFYRCFQQAYGMAPGAFREVRK